MILPTRVYLLVTLAAVLAGQGCASLQDFHYEHGQKKRTKYAWKEFCGSESLGRDYGKGWKAGYYDVLTGGSGTPPLVPPSEYWRPNQITVHDDNKRQDWYAGYQDGAMCASLQPDTHYIKLWTPPPPAIQPPGEFHLEYQPDEFSSPMLPAATSEPQHPSVQKTDGTQAPDSQTQDKTVPPMIEPTPTQTPFALPEPLPLDF